MRRIMTTIVNAPARSALLALILTFIFASGFWNLSLDSSAKGMLTKGDPDVEYLNTIRDVFGEAVIHSIIFKSNTVFRSDILETLLNMTFEAEGIEGVERVVSMATVSNLKGENGILNTDMLLMDVPMDESEMARLKEDTLSNSMFVGEVVNPEGTVTGLHLFLSDPDGEKGFENRILAAVDRLVETAGASLPEDVEIYHIGAAKVKVDIVNAINRDGLRLTPLAACMVGIVLFLFFRTSSANLIPVLTGLLSIGSTLGFMGVMGFAINPISVMIPTLLLVMGATEDIHLISEYMHGLENGLAKKEAILNMAVKSGTAIFLTSLTTLLGFATIAPNNIPILREFGIAATFGIAINFVLTVLTVPTMLHIYRVPKITKTKDNIIIAGFRRFLFALVTRHRVLVTICLIACVGICIVGIQKVYIETDYKKFFKDDAPVPVLYDKLARDLVGGTNFMVVVETRGKTTFQTHEGLVVVAKLHDYLNQNHGKAVGMVDLIRKTHQEMNDGDPNAYAIPQNNNLLAQYNLMMDADSLARFVNHDFSKTSILVRSRATGTKETMEVYEDIHRYIRENLPQNFSYHVTGEYIVVAKASNEMTRQIVTNLGYMFAVIFLFISLLFMSFKAGALAMIPNILPVLINFGVMGFLGIPLSTATFPVAIIALGIAVDDTIHFMVRYADELKQTESNESAIMATISKELRPIFSTSTALIAGFCVLLFAEFGTSIQFGKLAALCMVSALISDLIITPLLLIKVPIISPLDMLQIHIRQKLSYAKCKLLEGFRPGEIRKILTMGTIRTLEGGDQFIREGDHSTSMVLILEGEVEVKKSGANETLARLSSGEIVGEMGFLTQEPRSANVTSLGPTEIFEIDNKLITLVSRRFPRVGNKLFMNIAKILTHRLKEVQN